MALVYRGPRAKRAANIVADFNVNRLADCIAVLVTCSLYLQMTY